ncbi:MAG TPA: DUF2231 domain-containing protein [Gammaproteobacteria bacterium]|nr:DUF2231 domain-containing protein [Gammaproteobacteria bacterium]
MRTLRLGGHPLHPALVHFPVVFWSAAPCLDGLQLLSHGVDWWRYAYWSIALGVILALPAMVAGFLDLLALGAEHPAQATAQRHMLLMGSAWSVFVLDLLIRTQDAPSPSHVWLGLGVSLSGFALLGAGAHAGAQLVYDFGVGRNARGGLVS